MQSNLVTELMDFHRFAVERSQAGNGASIEDCLEAWREQQQRRAVVSHVLQGIADADAGRLHNLAEVHREVCQRLGIAGHA